MQISSTLSKIGWKNRKYDSAIAQWHELCDPLIAIARSIASSGKAVFQAVIPILFVFATD